MVDTCIRILGHSLRLRAWEADLTARAPAEVQGALVLGSLGSLGSLDLEGLAGEKI